MSSTTPDSERANNTATDSNTVATSANLSVTKSDGVTSVTAGDGVTYTYTITVSNSGPSDAAGSLLHRHLADGLHPRDAPRGLR